MMKKITLKKITFCFLIILFCQIIVLSLSHNNDKEYGFESKKAFQEFYSEFPEIIEEFQNEGKNEEKVTTELAKRIKTERGLRLIKDKQIRNFTWNLSEIEKDDLQKELNNEVKEIKRTSPDSYRILELKYESKVIKEGYTLISFTMEKILKLDSYEILKNQIHYFFIILTTLIFFVFTVLKLIKK